MSGINLKRKYDQKFVATKSTGTDVVGSPLGFTEKISVEKIFLRFLFLFLFIGALYSYEFFNRKKLDKDLLIVQEKVRDYEAQLKVKKGKLEEIELNQKTIKVFQTRLKLVRELGKSRLFEIRALDTLQSLLPDKLWLTSIKYDRGKGTMELEGKTIAIGNYVELVSRMDNSPYFMSNLTLKSEFGEGKETQFKLRSTLNKEQ